MARSTTESQWERFSVFDRTNDKNEYPFILVEDPLGMVETLNSRYQQLKLNFTDLLTSMQKDNE